MDAAKVTATEVESKLKKEIETLRKYVPSMSKPVDSSTPWYAGYAEPLIHIVKDEEPLKLRKAIEKAKAEELKSKKYPVNRTGASYSQTDQSKHFK